MPHTQLIYPEADVLIDNSTKITDPLNLGPTQISTKMTPLVPIYYSNIVLDIKYLRPVQTSLFLLHFFRPND